MSDYLLLKWGSIKGYKMGNNPESFELLKQYYADGVPLSAMADRPTVDRKAILCDLIDKFDGEISNDWDNEIYTKEQAKKYVMEYGA